MVISKSQIRFGEKYLILISIKLFFLADQNPHRKDSDAGRDWGQEEKGTTEDEMAGWHH